MLGIIDEWMDLCFIETGLQYEDNWLHICWINRQTWIKRTADR